MVPATVGLHGAIDALAKDLPSLDAQALSDALVDIRRAVDRLEAVFAHSLPAFEASGQPEAEAISLVSWLRWRCRLSPGAAADRAAVARTLPHLAATDAAPTSSAAATST